MKILVTGGAGYLGAVLVPKLLARGHEVRVLDIGYFGVSHLRSMRLPIELVREDILRLRIDRRFAEGVVSGCQCVVHLAAISNDPSAELHPELTEQVNFEATAILAEVARQQRVGFLFSSSCSVYGEAGGLINEEGAVNPLTVYANSKVKCEQMLQELADANWAPVVLRNGTLYGYSPRMRFDLVVNIFSLYGSLKGELRIFGDGLQWRPFLHVSDCARAFIHFIEQPSESAYRVYNIAFENHRVIDLVEIFREINPRLRVQHITTDNPDRRDYRVDNRRMLATGFKPLVSVRIGAEQLIDAIVNGSIPDPESIFYCNAKWLRELNEVSPRAHMDALMMMETFSGLHPIRRLT